MSTITDTQSFLFTRIPSAIKKVWHPEVLNTSTKLKAASPGRNHEDSVIQRIELSVHFHDFLTETPNELDSSTDAEKDRIEVWQEARRDWTSLEAAINEEICTFVARAVKRASQNKVTTVDSLTRTKTEFVLDKPVEIPAQSTMPATTPEAATLSSESRVRTIVDYPTIHNESIHPSDSVSVLNRRDGRFESNRSHKSSHSRSKGKQSDRIGFLRYLAEPPRVSYARR